MTDVNVTPLNTQRFDQPKTGGLFASMSTGIKAARDGAILAYRYFNERPDGDSSVVATPIQTGGLSDDNDLERSVRQSQPAAASHYGEVPSGSGQVQTEPESSVKINEQALFVADLLRNTWDHIKETFEGEKFLSLAKDAYDEVRDVAPESLRAQMPELERSDPNALSEPPLPPVKVEEVREEPSETKQRIAEQLSQLLRELLVSSDATLYKDEIRFFDALGVYLANQQLPKILGGTDAEADLIWEVIAENPLYARVVDRLRAICRRFDQEAFHRLLPRILRQLGARFEAVANAIRGGQIPDTVQRWMQQATLDPSQDRQGFLKQGAQQRDNNLCAPLQMGQSEKRYFAALLGQFNVKTGDAVGSLLNVMIPNVGADLLIQTVDLLCSEEMVHSYFHSIVQLLSEDGAESVGETEQRRQVTLNETKWNAIYTLLGSAISGTVKEAAGIANAVQDLGWVQNLLAPYLEVGLQSLLSADPKTGHLRFNFGAAAASLERMNRKGPSQPVDKKWLKKELATVSTNRLYVPGVLPRLHQWCLTYPNLFLRNLIDTFIVEVLHDISNSNTGMSDESV